jgi:hypothetical protein
MGGIAIVITGSCVVGLTATLLARVRWANAYLMFVAGIGVGLGFLALAYLLAPPNYESSNGVDGEMFLGRWWDPQLMSKLALIGYVGWSFGVIGGLLIRATAGAVTGSRGGASSKS